MNIANVAIGGSNPCRFVAELSNNHNGDLARAHRLIDAAKATGAEFVKFQAYTPDELVALRGDGPAPEPWGSQGYTMRSLYERARTPLEWLPELFAHARDIGLVPFSSVFGEESLAALEAVNCPAYKIARLDNASESLFGLIADTAKPVIVSMDYDDNPDPTDEVDYRDTLWLYCPSGYPQTSIRFQRCPGWEGFSFHGTDATPCVVAATLGAKIIEAHMMLADEPSELEANVSLTEHQFGQMIENVRRVEEMLA